MITHLATLLEEFPGSVNRTRCFAHILNLVAKCIMRQFDTPSKKEEAETELEESEDEDSEDDDMMAEVDDEDEGGEVDDNDDELADVRNELTDKEIRELEKSVKPVKLVLQKVRVDMLTTDKARLEIFYLSASKGRVCNETVNNYYSPRMVCHPRADGSGCQS